MVDSKPCLQSKQQLFHRDHRVDDRGVEHVHRCDRGDDRGVAVQVEFESKT